MQKLNKLLIQLSLVVIIALTLSTTCSAFVIVLDGNFYVIPIPDRDKDGYTLAQGDCNDNASSINPGAIEVCGDSIDQDCDGSDPQCPATCDTNNLSLCTTSSTCSSAGGYWYDYTCNNNDTIMSGTWSGSYSGVAFTFVITRTGQNISMSRISPPPVPGGTYLGVINGSSAVVTTYVYGTPFASMTYTIISNTVISGVLTSCTSIQVNNLIYSCGMPVGDVITLTRQ